MNRVVNGEGKGQDRVVDLDAEIMALEERLSKLKRLRRLKSLVKAVELDSTADVDFEAAASEIIGLVCERFLIRDQDLVGSRRHSRFVWPRHITAWLLRQLSLETSAAIGMAMGGREHSTILSSVRNVEKRMSVEPDFAALVAQLEERARAALERMRARDHQPSTEQ